MKRYYVDYASIARPDGPVGILAADDEGQPAEVVYGGKEFFRLTQRNYDSNRDVYDALDRCGIQFLRDGSDVFFPWYPVPKCRVFARAPEGGVFASLNLDGQEPLYFISPRGEAFFLAEGPMELLQFLAFGPDSPVPGLPVRVPGDADRRLLAEALQLSPDSMGPAPGFRPAPEIQLFDSLDQAKETLDFLDVRGLALFAMEGEEGSPPDEHTEETPQQR